MTARGLRVVSVTDDGVWRGRRTWTVRGTWRGEPVSVNVVDVDDEAAAIEQAREAMAARPDRSPAEREAMRRSNAALGRVLL